MAIQRQEQQASQQVQARHKDEIDAAMKKYRDEHAPKPSPTLGAPHRGSSGSSAPAATPAPTAAPSKPPATTTPQN